MRPLFEAQLAAYEYVLSLATGSEPVSEAAIRALHEQVCRAQETYRVMTPLGPREQALPKGVYKALPNHVRTRHGEDHAYAPVDVTQEEMHRLVREMRSDAFLAAHPVLQAAYAHYCFVVIHPFADGNGRVARALASLFTYRAISVPVVLLTEDKTKYLDALEASDSGDFQSFAEFLLHKSTESVELVRESLRSAAKNNAAELAKGISAIYDSKLILSQQVNVLGKYFLDLVLQSITAAAGVYTESGKIAFTWQRRMGIGLQDWSASYRNLNEGLPVLQMSTREPANASLEVLVGLWLPKLASPDSRIIIRPNQWDDELAVRIEDLDPEPTPAVRLRISLFAERVLASMLQQLKPLAEESLRKKQ